jgi:hypothetical protein
MPSVFVRFLKSIAVTGSFYGEGYFCSSSAADKY